VALYVGVALVIWGIAFLIERLIQLVTLGHMFAKPDGWSVQLHLAVLVVLASLFAAARRGHRSTRSLRAFEITATSIQALLAALLLGQQPLIVRPEFVSLFAATLFLMLRAGIVPGNTLGAVFVGVLAVLPSLALTFWLYSTQTAPPGLQLEVVLPYMLEWSAMALACTTIIHRVIYGLQERVQELGQYTLLHKIGEGGMGVVYRARHALLRRPTAVKVLPRERTTPTGVARFEREVQLTAELAHPNIVAIYDFGRTPDGSFYYAMEYLEGLDLQRLVEEAGPLPAARAVHLLVQAADALAEAHEVGLIHRDVKPANLFVSSSRRRADHLTVLDFGLAKDYSQREPDPSVSLSDTITGTPLYMAPESIVTPNEMDARSDLYALGAVGYWLLTGTAPFAGRTIVEVCAAHLHMPVESPSTRLGTPLARELEELILECLAKKKTDRPSGAAELVERLRALPAPRWSTEEAWSWWLERGDRAAPGPRQPLELARTLAIVRRH
jgi:eukaryotic-like serine/threonine-protein kinase